MTRVLRFTPPDHMVEITLRTIQGRLLLCPTPAANQTIAGVIGRAQRKMRMEIHAVVVMANHLHMLISPQDAKQMAGFMGQVGSNIARRIGKQVRWREKFWGRRYRAIVVSNEETAQVARLRYLLAHGAKEGFVASPMDWPGIQSARPLTHGSMTINGTWHDASRAYRDRQAGKATPLRRYDKTETIRLTPLPCWRHLTPTMYQDRMLDLIDAIEQETSAQHRQAKTAPVGASKVRNVHPHQTPKRFKRSPAPRFHAASKKALKRLCDAYSLFVTAYREAANALQQRDASSPFPNGCFPPALPFVPV